MRIYLAHPISSATDESKAIKNQLVTAIKESVPDIEIIDPSSYELIDGLDDEEIVKRNQMDIIMCDYVVADFTTPSSGVAMESMYAKVAGIPILALVKGTPSAWISVMCIRTLHYVDQLADLVRMIYFQKK